uniref:Uncharacterized protein n=2 Tax=Oryza TaxID=4527 RepID=A0A0D3FEL2_9ORYZ
MWGPHVKWRLLWRVCLSREGSRGPHLSMRWGPRGGAVPASSCALFEGARWRSEYFVANDSLVAWDFVVLDAISYQKSTEQPIRSLVTLAFADLLQHHGQSARKFTTRVWQQSEAESHLYELANICVATGNSDFYWLAFCSCLS